jgi:hypothetical protein
MKNCDLKALLREVLNEELNEMMHPDDAADMQGDGYSNQSQRAFAHSKMTTPINNDTEKAKELAKQGKYVVVVTDDVHCKSTDAVLGCSVSIYKVCDNAQEANDVIAKLHTENGGDIRADIISPESLKPKQQPDSTPTSNDDVPFEEGYGEGDMKKDKKKAFANARWTVKFNEIKSIIKDVINEELGSLPQFESVDPSQITPEIIQAMRNWAKDCQWRDVSDEAEIDEMPDSEIISGVAQNYDGGIEAFIADSQPTHANQQVAELYEAKGDNKKQKLVNLIKETIQEVMQEEGKKTKAELIKLWGGPNWISSPVPSGVPNEFVVKWMVNGKRDENKCYYTDDKQDAQDTYLAMSKTAMEMNLALQTSGQPGSQ